MQNANVFWERGAENSKRTVHAFECDALGDIGTTIHYQRACMETANLFCSGRVVPKTPDASYGAAAATRRT
jgi:hypothetical protein